MSEIKDIFQRDDLFLGIVLFTLPISIKLNSVAIIIASVYFLTKLIVYKNWGNLKYFIPSLIFFLIQFFSFLYSRDFELGSKKLILFLPFLIFPLFFLNDINTNKKHYNSLFRYLAFGSLTIILYGAARSFYDIYIHNVRFDYGYGLSLLLKYIPHHVYLSMFLLVNICLLFILIPKNGNKAYKLLLIAFFYFTIIFLASRTALFVSIFLLPAFVFLAYRKQINKRKLILYCCVFYLIFGIIVFSMDYTRDKILYFFFHIFNINTNDQPFLGLSFRSQIWFACIDLLEDIPFLGYSIGDVQFFLNSSYSRNGYYEVMNMNAHNQYLQLLITYGFMQTLLLLYIITRIIIKSVQLSKMFIFYTWVIILCFCLAESILNRQWGVVLFAFLLNFTINQLYVSKGNG